MKMMRFSDFFFFPFYFWDGINDESINKEIKKRIQAKLPLPTLNMALI